MDKLDSKLLKISIIINIISLLLHLVLAICKDKIPNFAQTYTSNAITVILFCLSFLCFFFMLTVILVIVSEQEEKNK